VANIGHFELDQTQHTITTGRRVGTTFYAESDLPPPHKDEDKEQKEAHMVASPGQSSPISDSGVYGLDESSALNGYFQSSL
jgi:hypothetical protein